MAKHPIRQQINSVTEPSEKRVLIENYVTEQRKKGNEIDLSDMDLKQVDFTGMLLHKEKKKVEKITTDEDGKEVKKMVTRTITTSFKGSDLTGAIFAGVDCSGVNFYKATLAREQLEKATNTDQANFTKKSSGCVIS